jgi:hypothetical protein
MQTTNALDELIIGGGINGIGTFRDLALNGVDVLLVERSDFCSGASAASSHMAHGGIRYLENGEFRLVREAVQALPAEQVREYIRDSAVHRLQATPLAPMLGNVLSVVATDDRHQALLDEALRLVADSIDANRSTLRDVVREQSPWWVPGAVDVGLSEQDPKDELKIELDRGLANSLGISVGDAAQALADGRRALTGSPDEHTALEDFLVHELSEGEARRHESGEGQPRGDRRDPDHPEPAVQCTVAGVVLFWRDESPDYRGRYAGYHAAD